MRALKYLEDGTMEVVDEPEPEPGIGDVLVEVAFAGICGSDLHGVLPGGYRTPPLIMGHEFSGVTSDGRRVTVNAIIGCGHCDLCLRGRGHVCRNREILGIDRPGGFAERVAVPESAIVELGSETSLEAAALVEPLAVAIRGWDRSGAIADSRVAILGAGNIGLLLLAVGGQVCSEMVIIDTDPDRRDVARRQGPAQVAATLDGEFDVVFDAVGSREAHNASLEHLIPGGTALWIGSRDADPGFDALDLVRSEKSVLASFAYSESDFRRAAEMMGSLEMDWAEVVDLEHSAQVFENLMERQTDMVKALIRS